MVFLKSRTPEKKTDMTPLGIHMIEYLSHELFIKCMNKKHIASNTKNLIKIN